MATLLDNGTVLIAGGYNSSGAGAELYNPATGSFTTTGSLNYPRAGHTATLLQNGMVLIAGGVWDTCCERKGPPLYPPNSELYNPPNGSFILTGNVNATRQEATAVLLGDGMTLVLGGFYEQPEGSRDVTVPISSAELYYLTAFSNINAVTLYGDWLYPPCYGPTCAGGTGTPSSYSQTNGISSPSLDGESMEIKFTGTKQAKSGDTTNVLWPYKVGAYDSLTHLIGTYRVHVPSLSLVTALEYDQFQFEDGQRFMYGSQCVFGGIGKYGISSPLMTAKTAGLRPRQPSLAI